MAGGFEAQVHGRSARRDRARLRRPAHPAGTPRCGARSGRRARDQRPSPRAVHLHAEHGAGLRSQAAQASRRREVNELAKAAPRDAIEALRRRLVNAADAELAAMEKRQKNGKSVPGEELRQVARAVREIAAIPGPSDARPAAPGARVNGDATGQRRRAGKDSPARSWARTVQQRPEPTPRTTLHLRQTTAENTRAAARRSTQRSTHTRAPFTHRTTARAVWVCVCLPTRLASSSGRGHIAGLASHLASHSRLDRA
jgi:hypothetical protein